MTIESLESRTLLSAYSLTGDHAKSVYKLGSGDTFDGNGQKAGAGIGIWAAGGEVIDSATIAGNVVTGILPYYQSGKVTNLVISGNAFNGKMVA